MSRQESELNTIRYFHNLCTNIYHISFETRRLDRIPILLFVVEQFSFQYLVLKIYGYNFLIRLFEKISTSRRHIYEIEIDESTQYQKHQSSRNLKKFNDTIVAFIFADDSRVGLAYLTRNKSKCSHTSKLTKTHIDSDQPVAGRLFQIASCRCNFTT